MSDQVIPKSLIEMIRYFSDVDVCIEFVASLRWLDGVTICPHCEGKSCGFLKTRRIWKCRTCRKQFSVKTGTIFEESPIALDKWLMAIWLVVNCKNGISSYEIARDLKVTQKSAWFMLHRIRLALKNGSWAKLGGGGEPVEVDETFIGGKPTYVAVEPFHLDRYLDEQMFRFNNRTTRDNPLDDADRFMLAVSQISGKRLTYAELTGKVGTTQF